MPTISIDTGKTETKVKQKLIQELTATASRITNVPESFFTVLINELDDENIGVGGKTLTEIKASRQ